MTSYFKVKLLIQRRRSHAPEKCSSSIIRCPRYLRADYQGLHMECKKKKNTFHGNTHVEIPAIFCPYMYVGTQFYKCFTPGKFVQAKTEERNTCSGRVGVRLYVEICYTSTQYEL